MTILATAQSLNDYCGSSRQDYAGFIQTHDLPFTQNAANFDATSVTYALSLFNSFIVRVVKRLPGGGSTLWTHCMFRTTSFAQAADVPHLMAYVSEDEVAQVVLRKASTVSGNLYEFQLRRGGVYITLPGGPINISSLALHELDIKWFGNATSGNVELYDGQTLIYSFSGDTTVDSDIRYVTFGGRGLSGVNTADAHVSEVIIADEPTLRMKLRNLTVASVASATNWTTNLGKVIAVSGGTSIDYAQPGNFNLSPGTLMFNMTDIPMADAAKRVRAVVVTKFLSVTPSSPITGTRTVLDNSGILSETANHTLFGNSENIQIEYSLNPATGQPWTYTEVNALKVGVKSV